jgi:hypothetical protein
MQAAFAPQVALSYVFPRPIVLIFVFIHLLIINCTFFPFRFFRFAYVDVSLCLATAPVTVLHFRDVFPQSSTDDYNSVPSLPFHLRQTRLTGTTPLWT